MPSERLFAPPNSVRVLGVSAENLLCRSFRPLPSISYGVPESLVPVFLNDRVRGNLWRRPRKAGSPNCAASGVGRDQLRLAPTRFSRAVSPKSETTTTTVFVQPQREEKRSSLLLRKRREDDDRRSERGDGGAEWKT